MDAFSITASISWQAIETHPIHSVELSLEPKVAGAFLALSSVELVHPQAHSPMAAPKHPSMESTAAKDHVVVRFTPSCKQKKERTKEKVNYIKV